MVMRVSAAPRPAIFIFYPLLKSCVRLFVRNVQTLLFSVINKQGFLVYLTYHYAPSFSRPNSPLTNSLFTSSTYMQTKLATVTPLKL